MTGTLGRVPGVHAPIVLSDPWDFEAYVAELAAAPPAGAPYSQLQADWDRFVTAHTEAPTPVPRDPGTPPMVTWRLPSPASRSVTPSPLQPALSSPLLGGTPLVRHTTGSPEVLPLAPAAPPRLTRASVRARERRRLLALPLKDTHHGRVILSLRHLPWVRAPSGFAAVRMLSLSNAWLANDAANYLRWLDSDIRVHCSASLQLVCLESLAPLNAILMRQGYDEIIAACATSEWLGGLIRDTPTRRGLPNFLRAGYSREFVAARRRRLGPALPSSP